MSFEYPVFVQMPTHNETALFTARSDAEVVISTLIDAKAAGWLEIHGFVLLPDALEMVCTPRKQSIAGVVAHIQAETFPLLAVLRPEVGQFWAARFIRTPLVTQRALDARLHMLLLAPVAAGLVETASAYPYSSANIRYLDAVELYTGFRNPPPPVEPHRPAPNPADTQEVEVAPVRRLPFEANDDHPTSNSA